MENDWPRLTAKQEQFCKEYLIDLNAKQAAIRAGYSEKTSGEMGYENLNKPQIAARVQELMAERSKRTEISADYVLNGIKELTERCIQAVPVLDENGEKTGEWRFEVSGGFKGYELLGKHLKLFTDKVDADFSGEININVNKRVFSAGDND
jgi:phage terminase small subunit